MVIRIDSRVVKRGNKSYCIALPKQYIEDETLPPGTNVRLQIRVLPSD